MTVVNSVDDHQLNRIISVAHGSGMGDGGRVSASNGIQDGWQRRGGDGDREESVDDVSDDDDVDDQGNERMDGVGDDGEEDLEDKGIGVRLRRRLGREGSGLGYPYSSTSPTHPNPVATQRHYADYVTVQFKDNALLPLDLTELKALWFLSLIHI